MMLQEVVATEQPVAETELVDQDPPIDPTVERAAPTEAVGTAEPSLPVSTFTGTGRVTSTPQLGPALPGAAPVEGAAAPVAAPTDASVAAQPEVAAEITPEPDFTNTNTEQPVVSASCVLKNSVRL